ncbi:ribonuclease HI [Candidatus Hakubella thermalkaliphila]|uniref:Ribonuclease HI n=2 Tax=Candidatus Hakubella thermalkaliphila TaxID=2754717 RepID=A0A6V8PZ87_9ACTN|nr:ribonuclease HI family protein [Candidatus Hakubella thermalkaliphila]MBT9170831.1 14.7 kDa ribonuclease H-like protein [Actinomycetota bacterium]GFP37530.1 ribonuclease HI [Candidatus Hakubella thermalkaliphila]GFP38519.1 ribonuclease HI [Candidatus Hakubella thermalkaliphila]
MAKRVVIYLDGGARGNPGPAGTGYLIFDEEGRLLAREGRYIGFTTNNVAEYTALVQALDRARGFEAQEIAIRSDSELVVRQLNRSYKVRDKKLKPLNERVRILLYPYRKVEIQHVPREENREADELVNQAIDEALQE